MQDGEQLIISVRFHKPFRIAIEASNLEKSQLVVKLLAFSGQVQWEKLKLFEREAQVLKQLNHPQIPKYRDYFCIDERLLWFGLVEEYLPGSSFKELLNQGKRFTEQQVRKIAVDVLNILIYLHELSPPVLHRDIKPSNLILGEDEQVYLVDFGAVQDKAVTEGATFTVVGTYGYTPMEQFGGRAVPASDLYALGATLIHLSTGIAPADLPQRDLRIQFSDRVSLSPSLVAWVEKLTEPAPERRFSTARQALVALESNLLSSKTDNLTNSLPTLHFPNVQICRPSDTRVQLNKSPNQLQIEILPQGIRKSSDIIAAIPFVVAAALFILIILSKSPVSIFLLFFVAPGIIGGVQYFLGSTQVCFDRNIFEIKKQLFDLTYHRYKAVTRYIQDVSIEYDPGGTNPVGVTITDALVPYLNRFIKTSFGGTSTGRLTETELIWLAQEIRDWLQAQKLEEPRH